MSEEDETKETRGGEAWAQREGKGTPRARKAVINGNCGTTFSLPQRDEQRISEFAGAMKSKIKRTEKR